VAEGVEEVFVRVGRGAGSDGLDRWFAMVLCSTLVAGDAE
jgi:hypothetical protein